MSAKNGNDWIASMPIYVTRKTAGAEETGSLSMSIWMSVLAMMLIWLNLVVWSVVGLVVAAQVVL